MLRVEYEICLVESYIHDVDARSDNGFGDWVFGNNIVKVFGNGR